MSKPLFDNPDYDVIADFGGRLERVQVNTSTCWRNGRFDVALATRGGNQSWNGYVEVMDRTQRDALFVQSATAGAGTSVLRLSADAVTSF